MLIYTILKKYKKELNFLGQSDENIELALSEITEFKKHNIMSNNISTIIEKVNDTKLKYKLADFEKIYLSYDNWMKNKFIDEEDTLTKLKNNLDNSTSFNDTDIYIDEFSGFTSQEYEIISKLMQKARMVTITICTDGLNIDNVPEEDIFYENKKIAQKLLEYAEMNKIRVEKPVQLTNFCRFKNNELKCIENNVFANKFTKYMETPKNIEIFLAANPYSELENVATEIVKLVKNGNYRYKDITIITNDIENIDSMAKAIFARFDIPVFIDKKNELTQNILIKYVLSIIEMFSQNWSKESVFNYLKLGFTELSNTDIYLLENYCNKWQIQGKKWFIKDYWKEEKINNIKNNFINKLVILKKDLEEEKNCKEFSKKIYGFLEAEKIADKLQIKIDNFVKNFNLVLADEYARSFEILINVLDEMVLLFQDEKMTFSKYSDLLKTAFKYEELGQIPKAIDQVIFGDINRTKSQNVKVMFIIGMNDRSDTKSK